MSKWPISWFVTIKGVKGRQSYYNIFSKNETQKSTLFGRQQLSHKLGQVVHNSVRFDFGMILIACSVLAGSYKYTWQAT
jgi:hypothetical protein